MSVRRQPSIPPKIPGYEFVRLLGMGGFADVFEYRQEFPRRSVAVKVLLSGSLDQDAREAFFSEANVMAQLSHHPSIVTVYHADIAADGRPFLVMEYCSRPGLGTRYRMERFTVAEVLRTGIRVASAVEAAHHLGILHRDIKPANILATDFGWPALTDFGIASTLGSTTEATGMSIPWSAPELLAENPTGDARGDVYSLAATLFSLLVGHSPFEVPGRSNTPADLISRIERSTLPPIDREDVPAGLSAVLARAMAKDPERRFLSALAFAHALQQVERSLHLPVTSIDLSQDALPEAAVPVRRVDPAKASATSAAESSTGLPEDQATRLRPLVSIDPLGGSGQGRSPAPEPADEDATRLRPITSIAAQGAAPTLAVDRPQQNPDGRPQAQPGLGLVHSGPGGLGVGPGAPQQLSTGQPGYGPGAPGRADQRQALATGSASFAPSADEIRSQHYRAKPSSQSDDSGPRRSRRGVTVLASVVVVAVLGTVAFLTLGSGPEDDPSPDEHPTPEPTVAIEASVPAPAKVMGLVQDDGRALFTWVNPDPQEGDTYVWREVDGATLGDAVPTDKTSALVDIPADQSQVCIQVSLVRSSGQLSTTPSQECSQ